MWIYSRYVPGQPCEIVSLQDEEILCELPPEPLESSVVGKSGDFAHIYQRSVKVSIHEY